MTIFLDFPLTVSRHSVLHTKVWFVTGWNLGHSTACIYLFIYLTVSWLHIYFRIQQVPGFYFVLSKRGYTRTVTWWSYPTGGGITGTSTTISYASFSSYAVTCVLWLSYLKKVVFILTGAKMYYKKCPTALFYTHHGLTSWIGSLGLPNLSLRSQCLQLSSAGLSIR